MQSSSHFAKHRQMRRMHRRKTIELNHADSTSVEINSTEMQKEEGRPDGRSASVTRRIWTSWLPIKNYFSRQDSEPVDGPVDGVKGRLKPVKGPVDGVMRFSTSSRCETLTSTSTVSSSRVKFVGGCRGAIITRTVPVATQVKHQTGQTAHRGRVLYSIEPIRQPSSEGHQRHLCEPHLKDAKQQATTKLVYRREFFIDNQLVRIRCVTQMI